MIDERDRSGGDPDQSTVAQPAPPRAGRRVVVTGDTRPCQATVDVSRAADLLVHDSTFGDGEAARAVETDHSTAREAARIAQEAGAARLVLTHLWSSVDPEAAGLSGSGAFGAPVEVASVGARYDV